MIHTVIDLYFSIKEGRKEGHVITKQTSGKERIEDGLKRSFEN